MKNNLPDCKDAAFLFLKRLLIKSESLQSGSFYDKIYKAIGFIPIYSFHIL